MGLLEESKDLGQLLLEEKLINPQQLKAAREAQSSQDKSIGRVLVDMGLITEQAKMAYIQKKFGFEIVDIRNMQVSSHILTRIPRSYAERFRCVPILEEKGGLVVAMEDPTNFMVLDQIKAQTNMEPTPVMAPLSDIDRIINQYPALTQAQVDRLRRRVGGTRVWQMLVHRLVLYCVVIAPLLWIFIYSSINNQFSHFLTAKLGSRFDVTLYIVLSWCLWAIFVWEIDGLLFSGHESEKEA